MKELALTRPEEVLLSAELALLVTERSLLTAEATLPLSESALLCRNVVRNEVAPSRPGRGFCGLHRGSRNVFHVDARVSTVEARSFAAERRLSRTELRLLRAEGRLFRTEGRLLRAESRLLRAEGRLLASELRYRCVDLLDPPEHSGIGHDVDTTIANECREMVAVGLGERRLIERPGRVDPVFVARLKDEFEPGGFPKIVGNDSITNWLSS